MLSHPIETQRNLSLLGFIIPGKSVKLRKNEAQRVFKATSVARKRQHQPMLLCWEHLGTMRKQTAWASERLKCPGMSICEASANMVKSCKIRFTSFDPNVLEWFYAFKSMAVSIRVQQSGLPTQWTSLGVGQARLLPSFPSRGV